MIMTRCAVRVRFFLKKKEGYKGKGKSIRIRDKGKGIRYKGKGIRLRVKT